MSIASLLERAIADAGSASAFARKVGVSSAYICNVRNGNRPASERIKMHLGIRTHGRITLTAEPWRDAE